ncbi:hypothetical protein C0Q44_18325 [Paenibacillus sp. PCH8]|nr:hypothetical protein C0Q44_18325 [Paenibacillus sp. PCH8]
MNESAIFFVKHQYSHAMSAWACSGYERALVLSLDKAEDGFSGLVAKGSEGKLERLHTFHDVDSMVGLCHQVGEIMNPPIGSLTELSHIAMKGRAAPYRAFFQACYELLPDGAYKLRFDPNGLIEGLRLEGHSGGIEQRCNLAAALQEVLEAIVFHIVRYFQEETGMDTLCVGGEFAGNVALNSKLLDSGLFTAVFVQPITHDAGAALGAALAQFSMENSEEKTRPEMEHVYWGTAIEMQDQIKEQTAHWREWTTIRQELGMSIAEQVADLLAHRHSVGWMQESAEFGTCSLGNRSTHAVGYSQPMIDGKPITGQICQGAIERYEWYEYYKGRMSEHLFFILNEEVEISIKLTQSNKRVEDLDIEERRTIQENREKTQKLLSNTYSDVEGQEYGPIKVAILAAFLFYRYKFLSRAKDKNLYRLPKWTRTPSYCRLGVYLSKKYIQVRLYWHKYTLYNPIRIIQSHKR